MMPPKNGELCQATAHGLGQIGQCTERAVSYHPYIGFVCREHLRQAQAAFNSIGERSFEPTPFSRVQTKLLQGEYW